VFEGYQRAKYVSGYSRAQIWMLLNNDRIKLYKEIVAERALTSLGISITEIVGEYYKMVDDAKASDRVKVNIQKHLIDLFDWE
jgi:hypothetical protein